MTLTIYMDPCEPGLAYRLGKDSGGFDDRGDLPWLARQLAAGDRVEVERDLDLVSAIEALPPADLAGDDLRVAAALLDAALSGEPFDPEPWSSTYTWLRDVA